MNQPVPRSPLKCLATVLQTQWQQRLGGEDADELSIRCAVRAPVLMVLVDHAACTIVDPATAIAQLEQCVEQMAADLIQAAYATDPTCPAAAAEIPVQLYLRLLGQSRPYQTQRCFWRWAAVGNPAIARGTARDPEAIAMSVSATPMAAATGDFTTGEFTGRDFTAGDFDDEEMGSAFSLDARPGEDDSTELPNVAAGAVGLESDELFAEEADESADAEADDLEREWWPWPRWTAIAMGGCISVVAFSGALYALTRPCVLGSQCPELEKAEQISDLALASLATEPTAATVAAAHADVQQANQILKSIPPWSSHHEAAVELRQTYQAQTQELDQVMAAQATATQAVAASVNPPHPISQWQTALDYWQTAVDELTAIAIAPESDLFDFVSQKLAEYEAHRDDVAGRIAAETAATDSLTAATEAAARAETQQLTADSMEAWQQVVDRWRMAVRSLRLIPQGTLAHQEATQLLTVYEAKLTQAEQQSTQQNVARTSYTEAIRSAESARQLEQQQQWTLAVQAWRQAVGAMRQVPSGSTYSGEAQSLTALYQDALVRAEAQLESAVARQQAEQDLAQTCAGTPTICTYTVAAGMIQVYLTQDYNQQVERAMITAATNRDANSQVQIAQHVDTLLRALVAIGDNARLPIELFDANGASLGRYDPRTTAMAPRS